MNEEIQRLSKELREKQQELVEARRKLPLEEIADYTFKNREGADVKLSDLFDERDELLVMHNMGKACVYCTMWADGFRGFTEVIADRMPWVLTSPDDYELLNRFAESRNWEFNAVSFHGTDFAKDLGFEYEKDGKRMFYPGASALIRKDGKIYRASYDFFGPGDLYNPAWHFFDLFPKGSNNWAPKYIY